MLFSRPHFSQIIHKQTYETFICDHIVLLHRLTGLQFIILLLLLLHLSAYDVLIAVILIISTQLFSSAYASTYAKTHA